MWKIFAVLVLVIIILIFILKYKNQKIKKLKSENDIWQKAFEESNKLFEKLNKEIQIEKKHTQELAKKLADISCMSIDDVMHQLQDDDSNRKDNI